MKVPDRIRVIRNLSEKNSTWIHKDVFRVLRDEELWILAYENIKANKGALTPGSDPSTLDGMSLARLARLREAVLAEQYEFKPVRQIMIPKPNGKLRPLGLPTANDKLVQEVIRIVLDAVYEPIFDRLSFGFRPGVGCHHALKHVESSFRWVSYVIEGDIESAFPTINHNILCSLINKRIDDTRFMNLIRKSLKCGVLDNGLLKYSSLGVPQGSIASPILSNIYFHELDMWVNQKAKELFSPPSRSRNPLQKKHRHKILSLAIKMQNTVKNSPEYKGFLSEIKLQRTFCESIRSQREARVEIHYVRYADDWMIGVAGPLDLAQRLLLEVTEFFETTLQQKLNPNKTKITDLRHGKASFLGYEIYLPASRPISKMISPGIAPRRRRQNPMLRFDVPVMKIAERLILRGYVRRLEENRLRPISMAKYSTLEDHVIVGHFKSVYQGLANYYSGCTNLSRLQYFHYLLHMSCAMTLAHRHRCSSAKIFQKHGKQLTIRIAKPSGGNDTTPSFAIPPDCNEFTSSSPKEGKTYQLTNSRGRNGNVVKAEKPREVSFPFRTGWSLTDRRWQIRVDFVDPFTIMANMIAKSRLGHSCAVVGCTSSPLDVEQHHVRHIRKRGVVYTGFAQQMGLLNRKQLPLCRKHHMEVHSGTLDGGAKFRS